jgi:cyclic pyranopterin phosphate synthase
LHFTKNIHAYLLTYIFVLQTVNLFEIKNQQALLSFHEITDVARTGVKLGITKIRFTGGEPLVRKGLPQLIHMIGQIEGIDDIGLTTNGTLLADQACELKEAGLKRVNISLDTLNPEKYRKITRGGKLEDVLHGIFTARKTGFYPVKINFVRLKGENKEDEYQVSEFCAKHGFDLRFIRQMDLSAGEFYPVEGGKGGICSVCNRLRLTADGYLVPCLFSDYRYSVREMSIEQAFFNALSVKPLNGKTSALHQFYNIGG